MASSMPRCEYDVFLSYCGEDTRKNFVGVLYKFLCLRGYRIFKDDEELERGKSIYPELVKKINESKIAVIVFSKNYASSSWCLDELVEILNCRRTKGQIVLPLFYNVKPSDVRKQKGDFGEAFTRLQGIHAADKVETWRAALKEAADTSGLDFIDAANGDLADFAEKGLEQISKKLKCKTLQVAAHEVGIRSRADKLIMQLNLPSEEKLFMGICGPGGIGKTTLAKAVFNGIINEFECCCFLGSVREKSNRPYGLAKLQKELLRETLMHDNTRISNADGGINEINARLGHKKTLIVLDDVDDEKQLLSLVGIGQDWFGPGSRIIITSRDKRVLEKYKIRTYDVEVLNDREALQLFSWHAFKQKKPKEEFAELSHTAKDYAKGLPLALVVLGSNLCNRSKPFWLDILDRLKIKPPKEILDVLRLSFEGLDEREKDLFLDVACFFIGFDKQCVENFFLESESDRAIGMQVLNERFLINISKDNKVLMHDLIQEMGRQIVGQEFRRPEERSRLWSDEDIYEVLSQNRGTENIQGIMLNENVTRFEELHASADVFRNMTELRLLRINGVLLDRPLTYLSNKLAYLDWDGYSQQYLPHNFHPRSLVELRLPHSQLKEIFTDERPKDKLKVIDLSESKYLEKSPNFSGMPNLVEVNFQGCTSLVVVHSSIAFHDRLVGIDFNKCTELKRLASRINLKSLKHLRLSGCSKLEKFPKIQGPMDCLELLSLDGTAIKVLPGSVKYLKGLKFLNLKDCKMLGSLPSNISKMKSLEVLWLGGSSIKELPPSIAQLANLVELDWESCNLDESCILNLPQYCSSLKKLLLGSNNFASLPSSFTQFTKLECLYLDGCLSLQILNSLPSSIRFVCARGCVSLKRYSIPTTEGSPDDRQWIFTDSVKLVRNHGSNKPDIYSESQLQEIGDIIIPGGEIPNWFSNIYDSNATSVRLKVDANSGHKLKGIVVCAVIRIIAEHYKYCFPIEFDLKINGYKITVRFPPDAMVLGSKSDHIMLSHKTSYNKLKLRAGEPDCDGGYIEASINTPMCVPFNLKKWGIHLLTEAQDEDDYHPPPSKKKLRILAQDEDNDHPQPSKKKLKMLAQDEDDYHPRPSKKKLKMLGAQDEDDHHPQPSKKKLKIFAQDDQPGPSKRKSRIFAQDEDDDHPQPSSKKKLNHKDNKKQESF